MHQSNQTKRMCVRHVTEVKRCSNEGCSNGVITEVSAVDMGQRSKYLASKDALIIPNEEDCARGMGQMKHNEEDFANGMWQIKHNKEEFARGTGQGAILMTSQLHSVYHADP